MQKPEKSHRYDALILGQGLAGSLLAWELRERGWETLVLDDRAPGAASRVAAGLINPVTGPRLVKTPLADKLLPALRATARDLEGRLRRRFLHPMPLVRRLDSERSIELWRHRLRDPAYRGFLDTQPLGPEELFPCDAPLGGFTQKQTGWLDAPAIVNDLRDWLAESSALRTAKVRYEQIRLEPQGVRWQDLAADRILFCEGYRLGSNPWFDWLPLQPAKGEILTLGTGGGLEPRILNAGRWLVPIGRHRFRFGATYAWEPLDDVPTPAGRDRLLADLAAGFPALAKSVELREHRAGVRPGTRDRHPFVGMHPQLPVLGVFNGFGAKGSLAIPWYARRFAEFLTAAVPLPREADIRRWWQGCAKGDAVRDEPVADRIT